MDEKLRNGWGSIMVNTPTMTTTHTASSPDSILQFSTDLSSSINSLASSSIFYPSSSGGGLGTAQCLICLERPCDPTLPINRTFLCGLFPIRQDDIVNGKGACSNCYQKLTELETLNSFKQFCDLMLEEARSELEQLFDLSRHTKLLTELEQKEKLRQSFMNAPETNLIGSLQLDNSECNGTLKKASMFSTTDSPSSWSSGSLSSSKPYQVTLPFRDDSSSLASTNHQEYFDITPILERLSSHPAADKRLQTVQSECKTLMENKFKRNLTSFQNVIQVQDSNSATSKNSVKSDNSKNNGSKVNETELQPTELNVLDDIRGESQEGGWSSKTGSESECSTNATTSSSDESRVNLELHLGENLIREALKTAALEAGYENFDYHNVNIKLKVDSNTFPLLFDYPVQQITKTTETANKNKESKDPIVVKLKRDIFKPKDGETLSKPAIPEWKCQGASESGQVAPSEVESSTLKTHHPLNTGTRPKNLRSSSLREIQFYQIHSSTVGLQDSPDSQVASPVHKPTHQFSPKLRMPNLQKTHSNNLEGGMSMDSAIATPSVSTSDSSSSGESTAKSSAHPETET